MHHVIMIIIMIIIMMIMIMIMMIMMMIMIIIIITYIYIVEFCGCVRVCDMRIQLYTYIILSSYKNKLHQLDGIVSMAPREARELEDATRTG